MYSKELRRAVDMHPHGCLTFLQSGNLIVACHGDVLIECRDLNLCNIALFRSDSDALTNSQCERLAMDPARTTVPELRSDRRRLRRRGRPRVRG